MLCLLKPGGSPPGVCLADIKYPLLREGTLVPPPGDSHQEAGSLVITCLVDYPHAIKNLFLDVLGRDAGDVANAAPVLVLDGAADAEITHVVII